MSKTPARNLAKAQRQAQKAQRQLAEARRAVNAAGAAPLTPGQAPPALPAPDAYDDHLMAKVAGSGDGVARELLRRRGTDGMYASYARHVLKTSTNPGMRAEAAGILAALDEDFDEFGPQPRPTGSAF